jgi:oxygen-dependent protoporphyrinogen oxidase
LAAAWELSAVDGASVTVHEASDHLGGKVHTSPFAGLAVDEGADAFLLRVPWAMDLVRELGLEDQVVHPTERRAYIWSRSALRPLPTQHVLGVPLDLDDLAGTGLLDDGELAETRAAYDQPGSAVTTDDVSVAVLVAEAAGRPVLDRVVAPLLGGINAGRVEDMSAATLTPQLLAAGRHPNGLLAGLREQRRGADPDAPVFGSFVDGTQVLVDRLVELLRARRVTVETDDPVGSLDDFGTDGIVVATPAFEAGRLLRSEAITAIPYASVVLVSVAVAAAAIDRPLDASGFLVARPEGLLLTACSWSSRKWAHLGTGETVVLRASAGSAEDQRAVDLPDDELAVHLLDELSTTMALAGPPSEIRVSRWHRSFPQYGVGHAERVADIEAGLPDHVVLAGAAYRGVGIPACIHSGREAARRLVERLGRA